MLAVVLLYCCTASWVYCWVYCFPAHVVLYARLGCVLLLAGNAPTSSFRRTARQSDSVGEGRIESSCG